MPSIEAGGHAHVCLVLDYLVFSSDWQAKKLELDSEDQALLSYWVTECSRSFRSVLSDSSAQHHLLSVWVSGHASQVLAQWFSTAGNQLSDLTEVQVSFLAWVTSWARRHHERLSADPDEIERISGIVWEQMDETSLHVVTIPRRLASQVLLEHMAGMNRMLAMGLTPPGGDDGWTTRFEPHLRKAITGATGWSDEQVIIIECTIEDVAKLAGAALALAVTATNPVDREAARSAVWYISQSLNFHMADGLLRKVNLVPYASRFYAASTASQPPTQQTTARATTPSVTAQPPVLLCSYCNTRFTGSTTRCPTCYDELTRIASLADQRGVTLTPSFYDVLNDEGNMPDAIPLSAVVTGSIVSLIVAFILFYIRWEGNFWLVIAFPAIIGISGGFVAACFAITKNSLFRVYYPIIPILIGITAYAATFWYEYEFFVDNLEDEGYAEVREVLSFKTFLEIKAGIPFSLSRVGSSSDAAIEGDPGDAYLLWTGEAVVAGGAGYFGWRHGIRYKHGLDEPASAA